MAMFGLLVLDKPSGVTSRRVVDRVLRFVRPTKVGHAGTLDPLAAGVLLLGLGQATRLVEYVHELPKQYQATFLLGRSSTTEDIDGEITELPDAVPPTREQIEQAADTLRGDIQQRPPAFSALKVAGRRAYELARAGETPELAPRGVRINRLTITRYDYPELCLDVECSSGTYVRSLGRDLAERAGSAAVMSALVRTAIGPFTLAEAADPEAITARKSRYSCAGPHSGRARVDGGGRAIRSRRRAHRRGLPVSVAGVSGERCARGGRSRPLAGRSGAAFRRSISTGEEFSAGRLSPARQTVRPHKPRDRHRRSSAVRFLRGNPRPKPRYVVTRARLSIGAITPSTYPCRARHNRVYGSTNLPYKPRWTSPRRRTCPGDRQRREVPAPMKDSPATMSEARSIKLDLAALALLALCDLPRPGAGDVQPGRLVRRLVYPRRPRRPTPAGARAPWRPTCCCKALAWERSTWWVR